MEKREISVAEYLQLLNLKLENHQISQKNVLTFHEAAIYMGVSDSCLYKMTMTRTVPHYKPRGKMIYCDRTELEKWLLQNRVATADEIEAKASTYVSRDKRSRK